MSEFSTVFLGLASAASWSAGDFSGGFATKRSSVYSVIVLAQIIGTIPLIALAILANEAPPTTSSLIWGVIGGWAGAFGLVMLYRGLATGRMGIVAPVSALVTGFLPVMVSLFTEGLPSAQQMLGFAIALGAVWLLSAEEFGGTLHWRDFILPVLAGIGFGIFFIAIDQMTTDSTFWPLIVARSASLSIMVIMVYIRRGEIRRPLPWLAIVLAGLFDTAGNFFFALATQAGRLDVASIAASLYPAGTVVLAWIILHERVSRQQWLGVGAALIAVILITT